MKRQMIVPVGCGLVLALLVPARAGEPPAAPSLPSCVVLDDEEPEQRGRGGRPLPEPARLAPTERELREIINVLGRPDPDKPSRILSEERLASPTIERMGVLVGDVRAIMVATDARESLRRIERSPGVPPSIREWLKGQVSAIEKCAQGRFVDRGGEPVLRKTEDLVEKLRDDLGPAVFQTLRRPPRPPKDPK